MRTTDLNRLSLFFELVSYLLSKRDVSYPPVKPSTSVSHITIYGESKSNT